MVLPEFLGNGAHASSVQQAMKVGWKYDRPCPAAGVGWTRMKKFRVCSRQGERLDFEYVAPDGKRFRSLVAARKYADQISQDSAVACAACASEDCTPGDDIVICDGPCGLAFHQQRGMTKVQPIATVQVVTHQSLNTHSLKAAHKESPCDADAKEAPRSRGLFVSVSLPARSPTVFAATI